MKRKALYLGLSILALLPIATRLAGRRAEASPGAGDPLIVHEWGTFTSFQGTGGVSVDGMQHETEALPSFVHSRVDPRTSPLAMYGDTSRDVPVRHCTGKMETPVIYFHSKTARHVKVHVGFGGLLTQWYPAASGAAPAFTGAERYDLGEIHESSLDWDLDVLPGAAAPPGVPAVDAKSDWQKAREVEASYVRASGAREAEQYVFYRGLMRSVVQPMALPTSNDDVTLVNGTPNTIATMVFLDMKATTGRFTTASGVVTGMRPLSLAGMPERSKSEVVADVERTVSNALVAQGLYPDEARAMVRTWSETWFSAEGTRVLYLVPRPVTDATLPITISPTPGELVRVMVGRIELLTPAKEAEVAAAMRAAQSPEEKVREEAFARIAKLGRFAEPAVRSIALRSADPTMGAAAQAVLARLALH